MSHVSNLLADVVRCCQMLADAGRLRFHNQMLVNVVRSPNDNVPGRTVEEHVIPAS
jgi:hypothetical protein